MYELVQRICVGAHVVGYQLIKQDKVIYASRAQANSYAKKGLIKGVSYNKKADVLRGISVCISKIPKKTVEQSDLPLQTISLELFTESQDRFKHKAVIRGIVIHSIYKSTTQLGSFEIDFSLVDTTKKSSWLESAYVEGLRICKSSSKYVVPFQPITTLENFKYCTFYRISKEQFLLFLEILNCTYYGVANSTYQVPHCLLDYRSVSGTITHQHLIEAPDFDYLKLNTNKIPDSIVYEAIDIIFHLKWSIKKLSFNTILSKHGVCIPLIDTWTPKIAHII